MRDAVDYVYERRSGRFLARTPDLDGARPSVSATRSRIRSSCARPWRTASWCAEIAGRRVERAPRVPRRRRARLGGGRPRLPAYGDLAEGKLTDLRKAWSTPARWRQVADEARPRRRLLLGKGEAARRRAPQAVDPVRRLRSGDRRDLPRRRRRRRPTTFVERLLGTASRKRSPASTASTTRRRCRSWPPACSTPRRSTCCTRRAPITPSGSSPPCASAARRVARARVGRRSRPSRPPPGRRPAVC